MHSNRYWLIFLAFLVIPVGWKSGEALYRLYGYYRLTGRTEGKVTQWSVEKKSDERYVLKAHYHFLIGSKEFESEDQFLNDSYLNAWAAEQAIKQKTETTPVWYSARNPLVSSLQKKFPIKECLSAVVLWVLLLYFIGLGYYVGSHGSDRSKKSDSR